MGWGLLETCAAIKCEENHRPSGHNAALLTCWDEGEALEGNLGENLGHKGKYLQNFSILCGPTEAANKAGSSRKSYRKLTEKRREMYPTHIHTCRCAEGVPCCTHPAGPEATALPDEDSDQGQHNCP